MERSRRPKAPDASVTRFSRTSDTRSLARRGETEPPVLTSGDDLETISTFLAGRTSYTAADVISYLLGESEG